MEIFIICSKMAGILLGVIPGNDCPWIPELWDQKLEILLNW